MDSEFIKMKKDFIIYKLDRNNLKEDLRKLKDYLLQKNFHFDSKFSGGGIGDIVNNKTNCVEGHIKVNVPIFRGVCGHEPYLRIEGDTKLEEVVSKFYRKFILNK